MLPMRRRRAIRSRSGSLRQSNRQSRRCNSDRQQAVQPLRLREGESDETDCRNNCGVGASGRAADACGLRSNQEHDSYSRAQHVGCAVSAGGSGTGAASGTGGAATGTGAPMAASRSSSAVRAAANASSTVGIVSFLLVVLAKDPSISQIQVAQSGPATDHDQPTTKMSE